MRKNNSERRGVSLQNKMKVLLVFPPLSAKERYDKNVSASSGTLPPLGLCYMAAILEKKGHVVKIIDCPVNSYTQDNVLKEIENFKPDWVGLSAITLLIDRAIEITNLIKGKHPKIKILIGGPHATIMPKETLKQTKASIVISGECEDVLANIIEGKIKKKIVYAKPIKDLDKLPFPARHLLDMKKYTSLPNNYRYSSNVFQILTTRGCPYTCTYCASANGIFRQRSVENVIAEIKHLIKDYNIREIAFWDDIFTMNRQWVIDFCDTLKQEKIKLAWSCETRLNLIDSELARKMKKAGCWNIFLGIEAGVQELLDNVKKRTTLDVIRKGMKAVKKAGIEVRGAFMLGLPGETPELARKTIDFAIELDPDYAQFSLTTPYPGTELYKTYEKWGKLDKNFSKYHIWAPVFLPHGYKSFDELKAMQEDAFRKFYFRPKYIIKRLLRVRNLNDLRRNLNGLKFILSFAQAK